MTSDWPIGNDRRTVREQYSNEVSLSTRTAFWQQGAPGTSPQDIALAALRRPAVRTVLEIGCGRGEFALRMQQELSARVLATDQSRAMVRVTAARGVSALLADADQLPFGDGAFDAVVAMWMLYHVPDLDRALAQVRRVLRPGGLFVAVTNGREHIADLLALVGLGAASTQFMTENGAEKLAHHFERVECHPTRGIAPADHATARAYLASFARELADRLEYFAGVRTFTGSSAVFIARSPQGTLGT